MYHLNANMFTKKQRKPTPLKVQSINMEILSFKFPVFLAVRDTRIHLLCPAYVMKLHHFHHFA
jgi:hypothetical protein